MMPPDLNHFQFKGKRLFVLRMIIGSIFVLLNLFILYGLIFADSKSVWNEKDHPANPQEQICLSLRALSDLAKENPNNGVVENLVGIDWIEGYVVDKQNKDIILIGRNLPNRPPLHLDDLVVNLRNIWNHDPHPYCSLDPRRKDNLKFNKIVENNKNQNSIKQMRQFYKKVKRNWGPQIVVVGGVPLNSKHAHTMIDADYHMKKVSQGIITLPDIRSCLDFMVADTVKSDKTGSSMSRFWFQIADNDPTFQRSDGIVILESCSVVLLTESQKTDKSGELYDSGEDDPIAEAFAKELTENFALATTLVQPYSDLESLFRLRSILIAIFLSNAFKESQLDLNFLLFKYQYRKENKMPKSYPGLTNCIEIIDRYEENGINYESFRLPMVSGGVSMKIAINESKFLENRLEQIKQLRKSVFKSRPPKAKLFWILPAA